MVLTLGSDIADHKRPEEMHDEGWVPQLIEHISDAFFLLDKGRIIEVNQQACDSLGYTREELLGMSLVEFEMGSTENLIQNRKQKIPVPMTTFGTHRRKDGSTFPVEVWTGNFDYGGRRLKLALVRDISGRQQAERALKESEEKYRLLVSQIPAVVYQGYVDWSIDFFDRKVEALTGYRKEEFDCRKVKWADLILLEDLAEARGIFITALKGDRSFVREYRIRSKAGEIRSIQDRGQIYCDDAGKVACIKGIFFDITESKAAEKARQEHLNFLQTLIDAIPSPIFYKDVKGIYLECNKALCDFLGLPKEEIVGKSLFEVYPKDLADKYHEMDAAIFRQAGVQRYDFSMQHADGSRHSVNFNKATYSTIDGTLAGLVGVMVDITDRERAEEKLRESEQNLRYLASQLLTAQERERQRISQDLHDDLGQSLMVLKLQVRAIERAMPASLKKLKQLLGSQTALIDDIVNDVRRFSRDLRPAVLDDLGLIVALKRLLEEFGALHGIEFSLDLDDVGDLLSPQAQISIYRIFQESLTNLGKYAQASRVAVSLKKENDEVFFSVEDNGKGFDLEQVRARDVATRGLGLTAMEERVRMIGGILEIQSQIAVGTRISFKIPVQT